MATKHVSKRVTLTVKEWDTLGKAVEAAASKATPSAAKVLRVVRDLALIAVDEAGK